jgi:uncharacterized membrane protein
MYTLTLFLHLAASILWMGGMFFMLWCLRPVALTLQPPVRVQLMVETLARFFRVVALAIAVLLVTGALMLASRGMKGAPAGQHLMLGIGLLMFALFGHIFFGPFRKLRAAADAQDWPAAALQMRRMHPFVVANFVLGWIAIAGVLWLR